MEDRPRRDRRVEILYSRIKSKGHERVYPHQMLFTFSDLAEDFGRYLANWFTRSQVLEPVFNLYFGTLFNPEMYGEHRFLSLVQAVESYHRRTDSKTILIRNVFRRLRHDLCSVIDAAGLADEAAGVFKSKIGFLNEIPLRERPLDLLASQGSTTRMLITDSKQFVAKVADTRNFLTHFDHRLEDRAARGLELYHLTEQLRFLVELLLLTEIGFGQEKREAILRKRPRNLPQG